MPDEYAPKFKWRPTWPDPEDAASHKIDFSGWDGDVCIGRIRFEPNGLQKGTWQWSGLGPHVRERLLPHQGYEGTARKAAVKAEDYYDRLLAHDGTRADTK